MSLNNQPVHIQSSPKSSLRKISASLTALLLTLCVTLAPSFAPAQTGGEGAISGTVADSTGAFIPGAAVVARNVNTGVETKRVASGDGLYNISPIIPGMYSLTVTAAGFSTFKQENIQVNALSNVGLNVSLKAGSAGDIVTVTDAPPALETTNSTLGGTIDNATYTALPVMITGSQQRDVTQFSNLLPGAQVNPGGRSSIIGGTGQRVGELYLDGLPLTTLSQQGDNRPIFNIVPLEAIDQIKVVTSGFNAEYQGAGLENYNTKSGGNKYHGAIFAYFRNTIFDAWSFSTKPGGGNVTKIVQNGAFVSVPGPKPAEHQTELGFTIGGPITIPHIINGHDKLFFFATYDKFRSRIAANPSASTIPTTLMRQGNFQELIPANPVTGGLGNTSLINYPIYDPTTQAACTAHSTTGPCRYQYGYGAGAGNGAAGNPVIVSPGRVNVIPASQLSPITRYMQQYLPAPTIDQTGVIQNNFLGGQPQGFDNWLYSGRIDYTISPRQTLSMVLTGGNRHAVPFTNAAITSTNGANLPVPYLASTLSTVGGHWVSLEHTFILTPNLVNQFKFGFMNFGGPPVQNITQGNPLYSAASSGILGLPAGQASENFPNTTFSGSNSPANWVGNTPTTTNVSETYTLKDNLSYLRGKHSMNFGFQYQWLENNASTADGASLPTTLTWSTNSTAAVTGTGSAPSAYTSNTGYSYASYLLGAVSNSTVTQQPFGVLGGRFHPFAVYGQDDFKVIPKLTLNIGLRWDYLPTFNEAQDRWSFLNPNIANPVTGNLGALQFAGNRGAGVSCNCRTPVNNFYKNFGPRLGLAYSIDDKTVIRAGFGILYSHAGGTGGAGGASSGTGQLGFTSTTTLTDSFSGPAFYLNPNPAFSAPNATWGGPGFALAPPAGINAVSQTLGTGYYVCSGQSFTPCNGSSGNFAGNGTSIAYADPYLGGRAPTFNFWNFGMQREITKDITVTANYVGSQSHFIGSTNSNLRGLQSGQLDPKYYALGANLTKAATPANIAAAQAATGVTIPVPYAGYTAAAALSSNATIAHMLTWMPQYNTTTDPWGNVANGNYNAFQLSVAKRAAQGLTITVNYTYAKTIDDAGTSRSGYALPASATASGRAWSQNRIDRSVSLNSIPQNLSIYGVYQSPFGKNKIGGNHFLVRTLLGGWQTGNIFQYSSGIPLPIVATCNASNQNVGAGTATCMPDVNPNFSGAVRKNGGWGKGATAANLGTLSYLNGALTGAAGAGVGGAPCASTTGPFCDSGMFKIGDSSRIAPYGLRGPGFYRLTSNLHRTFDLTDRAKFIFGVDCQNVTNSVNFGNNAGNNQIGSNVDTSTFGTVNFASADARAFQFSGRFTF
ncbi:TonB-dependent receptor [Granulicella sp. dw_53]|uniref:TonB-dependent receptor n=1 Tax=Granulicella sp. dw_53 TaxID=2719792 RepID=UPI001BD47D0F|nr:TonB-dependent receptor [Granulicella sp. dw_53]